MEVSISYASDWSTQGLGTFVDDVTLPDGTVQSFETGLEGWTVSGAPAGSAANGNDWIVTDASGFPVGAAISTAELAAPRLRVRGHRHARRAHRGHGEGAGAPAGVSAAQRLNITHPPGRTRHVHRPVSRAAHHPQGRGRSLHGRPVRRPRGAPHASAATNPRTVPLGPVADERDGVVRLHVPEGFRYRSFHDTTDPVVLTDGTVLPGRHDGMGAFPGPDGTVVLVRNHEINNPVTAAFGTGTPYDARAGGGTTTIQVTNTGEVIRSFTSLNGTMMNCSGGQMPWGSWITCEETVNGPDVGPDFTARPTSR